MPSQPATDLSHGLHAVVLDQPESMGKPTLQRAKLFPDLSSALADKDVGVVGVIVRDPATVMAAGLAAGQTAAEAAAAWKARAQHLLASWRADRRRIVLIDVTAMTDRGSEAAEAVRRRFGGILPISSGTITAPAPQPALAQVLAWALTEQLPDLTAVIEEWRTAVIAGAGPFLTGELLEEAVTDWLPPRGPVAPAVLTTAAAPSVPVVPATPAPEIEELRRELDQLRSRAALQEAVLGLKSLADGAELARLRRSAVADEAKPGPGVAPARPSATVGKVAPLVAPKPAVTSGAAKPGIATAKPGAAVPAAGAAVKAPAAPGAVAPGSKVPAQPAKPAGVAGAVAKPAGAIGKPGAGDAKPEAGAKPAAQPGKPAGPSAGPAKPAGASAKAGVVGVKPAGAAAKPGAKPGAPAGKPGAAPGKPATAAKAPSPRPAPGGPAG